MSGEVREPPIPVHQGQLITISHEPTIRNLDEIVVSDQNTVDSFSSRSLMPPANAAGFNVAGGYRAPQQQMPRSQCGVASSFISYNVVDPKWLDSEVARTKKLLVVHHSGKEIFLVSMPSWCPH